MAKTSELEAAYRATTYRVFLPGGLIDLRIGQACPQLANWLAGEGCSGFAIMTAFNPGAQRLAADENAERQARLECDLLEGNYEPYAAENVPDDPAGPVEEACFVPDIPPEDAAALAADYCQNAIVCGGPDGVPELLWMEGSEQ